jgi:hypothetical protein
MTAPLDTCPYCGGDNLGHHEPYTYECYGCGAVWRTDVEAALAGEGAS